mmetsp:Transcript_23441/g.66898  ORF Transcript_23441/g.66898 Transcript_23441/m.66898 type:complete len:148 (-) Transcript_23441:248-691(-)
MSGQAGLRTINNNYVASGDGRDLLIYHDQNFRGGKAGMSLTSPHLPSPNTGQAKLRRPVGSSVGYNARVEAHTQHLNLSQSSFRAVADKKCRMSEGLSATGASVISDTTVAHSLSQPTLEGRNKPFRFVWKESSQSRAMNADWNPAA